MSPTEKTFIQDLGQLREMNHALAKKVEEYEAELATLRADSVKLAEIKAVCEEHFPYERNESGQYGIGVTDAYRRIYEQFFRDHARQEAE